MDINMVRLKKNIKVKIVDWLPFTIKYISDYESTRLKYLIGLINNE